MNQSPIYIEFTNSAFGFVGRSVYQRRLVPDENFRADDDHRPICRGEGWALN